MKWFGHLVRMLLGGLLQRVSEHIQLAGDTGLDSEHAGGIIYLIWSVKALGPQRGAGNLLSTAATTNQTWLSGSR